MKRFILAAVAAIALGPPAHAQMTEARCEFSWGLFGEAVRLPRTATPPVLEGDRCVARDLDLEAGDFRVMIDEVSWRVDGLEAFLVSQRLLTRVELSVQGLRYVHQTNVEPLDYVLVAQARAQEGISGDLVATQSDGRVELERLYVDFPGDNAVSATALVEGYDTLETLDAVLREAQIDVTTHGLFETYALMPLASMLLDGAVDVEAKVELRRAAALAMIQSLSDAIVSADSRAALAGVLQDLPNPAGDLTLRIEAPGGATAAQLYAATRQIGRVPLDQLLPGVRLTAGYVRDGGQ